MALPTLTEGHLLKRIRFDKDEFARQLRRELAGSGSLDRTTVMRALIHVCPGIMTRPKWDEIRKDLVCLDRKTGAEVSTDQVLVGVTLYQFLDQVIEQIASPLELRPDWKSRIGAKETC